MSYDEPLFFRVMEYARTADRDVIDMVSGDPDWDTPRPVRDALCEYAELDIEAFQYPPSDGLVELRKEIASRRGVDVKSVIVTNGAGEANYLAMAAALDRDAGTEVILTDPVYPYYPGKTEMLGGEATYVPVATDGRLDATSVADAVSQETACIVVNTPNNPTGAVYDETTVSRLVEIAEANDAILVSDEVYDHFDYAGRFHSALNENSTNVIVTNAFSKSLAMTGFRVGYGLFPPALAATARTRHMLVNVATSRPAQYAVLEGVRETDPSYYAATRSMLKARIDAFTDALEATGARYTRPDGAFYVMARFPGFEGTLENTYKLIDEAGVAGMPGETFGSTRAEWLRFALVTPRAAEAAERLAEYFA